MKPVYAAGMLYQHLPPNADITFEAGMFNVVLGEKQSLSGINGAAGWSMEIVDGLSLTRGLPLQEMNGVAWNYLSSINP